MERSILNRAHFIRINLCSDLSDPRDYFIESRTDSSISVVDIHDGQTRRTHQIIEDGEHVTLAETSDALVLENEACWHHINNMSQVYHRRTEETKTTYDNARLKEEDYMNCKGSVAQRLNWPQTPT